MPTDLFIVVGTPGLPLPPGLWSLDPWTNARAIQTCLLDRPKVWFGEADWSVALDTVPTVPGPSDRLISLMGKERRIVTADLALEIAILSKMPDDRGLERGKTAELEKFLELHAGHECVLVMQ